ncbi:Sugar transporter domain-containing protein [Rozella allomycis CSF55]|uniref:Sugar transporter domain-containing protein n=1 Tax=Rozella allomycis (strain CSF55) TaxID=988480 RepID=A0A075B4D1_ROZAC|nr:Sugar transporter domain-containing protein [Rozella allomycis CSF55]|eukprot:EPZ36062.1 Sugar transporter domain-containing protein [Rozella allomycis CSF55]
MGLANIVELVIVGRFLIGIASGLSTVAAPGYLGEIAPARIRGAIGSLHPISLVFGIFMAQVLGIPWFDANNWRLLFGFGVITTTIQFVGLIFCYDCPSFYIKQNDTNYALESYKTFNSPFNEEEFKKLSEESRSFTHVSIPQLLRTKIAYRSLVINVLLQMFLQFSGINGVFFFSTIIFQQAGNSDIATYVSMGLGLTNFLFTLSTVYFVEKFGRRSLLLVGTIGQALCSILIVIFLNFSINVPFVIAIYFFIAFFAIGLGCIPWIITSDIFPPNAVPAAGSVSVTMNWVSNFIVAITFQSMVGGLGRLFFLPYMGVLIVASVFVYFMCRETKGKTPGYIVNIVNQENENA